MNPSLVPLKIRLIDLLSISLEYTKSISFLSSNMIESIYLVFPKSLPKSSALTHDSNSSSSDFMKHSKSSFASNFLVLFSMSVNIFWFLMIFCFYCSSFLLSLPDYWTISFSVKTSTDLWWPEWLSTHNEQNKVWS